MLFAVFLYFPLVFVLLQWDESNSYGRSFYLTFRMVFGGVLLELVEGISEFYCAYFYFLIFHNKI
jgi:hypothetical protein